MLHLSPLLLPDLEDAPLLRTALAAMQGPAAIFSGPDRMLGLGLNFVPNHHGAMLAQFPASLLHAANNITVEVNTPQFLDHIASLQGETAYAQAAAALARNTALLQTLESLAHAMMADIAPLLHWMEPTDGPLTPVVALLLPEGVALYTQFLAPFVTLHTYMANPPPPVPGMVRIAPFPTHSAHARLHAVHTIHTTLTGLCCAANGLAGLSLQAPAG